MTYLVASAWDYDEARLYELHRFSKIEILDATAKVPERFNLDVAIAIATGLAYFANQGVPTRLELRCTEDVAGFLAKTPLAADQTLAAEADGWVRLTATVNDTRQLQWWLLGQGNGVEVCGPDALRSEILDLVQKTLGNYTNASPKFAPTDRP